MIFDKNRMRFRKFLRNFSAEKREINSSAIRIIERRDGNGVQSVEKQMEGGEIFRFLYLSRCPIIAIQREAFARSIRGRSSLVPA